MYQQMEILQTVIIASKVGSIVKQAHRASFLICICAQDTTKSYLDKTDVKKIWYTSQTANSSVPLSVIKQSYKVEQNYSTWSQRAGIFTSTFKWALYKIC